MTIYKPLTEQQEQYLTHFLESDAVSDACLDFIAMHGFLTGTATGPEPLKDHHWLPFIFDTRPQFQSEKQHSEIEAIIKQLFMFIQRSLYLDEELHLPCASTVADVGYTNSLTDWCFGFMEAIGINEDNWFCDPSLTESIAELILPIGILSNQIADPALEHIILNNKKRQQMANNLTENVQNLYLLFRE